uniref:Uncharacterized protein n=1 Tax=Timema shepardi TaxID=629360 RepID=A0A7R9AMG9_TIMSH|nr:unnamed protein product [Timema shepardi]
MGCVALLKSEQQFISDVLMRPTPSPVLALYNDGAPLQPSHPQSREAIQGRIKSRGSTHADGDLLIPFLTHVSSPQQDAVSGRWWLTQGPMTHAPVHCWLTGHHANTVYVGVHLPGEKRRSHRRHKRKDDAEDGADSDPGDDSEDESRPTRVSQRLSGAPRGKGYIHSTVALRFVLKVSRSLARPGRPLSTEKFLDSSVAYYWCV